MRIPVIRIFTEELVSLRKWNVSEITPPLNSSGVISVQEGSKIRLRCAASGKPQPVIQWTKIDGAMIPMGPWHGINGLFNSVISGERD